MLQLHLRITALGVMASCFNAWLSNSQGTTSRLLVPKRGGVWLAIFHDWRTASSADCEQKSDSILPSLCIRAWCRSKSLGAGQPGPGRSSSPDPKSNSVSLHVLVEIDILEPWRRDDCRPRPHTFK